MVFSKITRPPGATSARIAAMRQPMTYRAAAQAWGVNQSIISVFEKHEPAPNHPSLAKIAHGLGITVQELTRGTTAPPLDEKQLALALHGSRIGRGRSGGKASAAARKLAAHNGATPVQRRGKHATAQTLRTIITSLNVARMTGKKTVDIPIAELDAFVSAILTANGTKPDGLLVRQDFGEVFG